MVNSTLQPSEQHTLFMIAYTMPSFEAPKPRDYVYVRSVTVWDPPASFLHSFSLCIPAAAPHSHPAHLLKSFLRLLKPPSCPPLP